MVSLEFFYRHNPSSL